MNRRHTRIGVLAASAMGLATLGMGAAAPAASAAEKPDPGKTYIVDCQGNLDYKPKEIVFACGDGGVYFGKIRWSSWDMNGATGVGTLYYNTCVPNCSAGNVYTYPKTKITLGGSASGPGFGTFVNTFSQVTGTFKNQGPAMAQSSSWKLDNPIRD
jgi:hypothetical protein